MDRRNVGRAGAKYAVDENEDEYENSGEGEADVEREMIHESHEPVIPGKRGAGQSLSAVAGAAGMMNKISGALLAKAFLPSPDEVKQCLVYTDLAIKMQMIVFDLSSSLWWTAIAEFLIFCPFGLFVFFLDPEHMGFIWFFVPHLVRGVISLLILKKMPTTHDMISKIDMEPNESIPFSKISKVVVNGAASSVEEFQQ